MLRRTVLTQRKSTPEHLTIKGVVPLHITATGHGRRQMCVTDPHAIGFPKQHKQRSKTFLGYRTGDMVKAVTPKGTVVGRIAIRHRPSFRIGKSDIHPKYMRRLQKADGYEYELKGVVALPPPDFSQGEEAPRMIRMNYPYYSSPTSICVYRFPGFRWNVQQQCWIPEKDILPPSILKPRKVVHEQVDPVTIPLPAYQPGQCVTFKDTKDHKYRGHVETVMIYNTVTEDPDLREYLYQWTYRSIDAITYWICLANATRYPIKGPAILSLVAPSHN